MTKRTKEELNGLFEKQGLEWVREQLKTSGGEINMLESPYAHVWVENQQEAQIKKEKNEERVWNLVFLLVGAIISAAVVLFTTKAQLVSMEKQHRETILQQQKSIEETFKNGINLMVLQYKIEGELRFLSEIYASIENDFEPIFPKMHAMRNNWKEQVFSEGKKEYLKRLLNVIEETSAAVKRFDKVLKNNSQHKEIYDEFYKTLSFQSSFFNPINDLYRAIEIFPEGFTVESLKILDQKGDEFSKAVSLLNEWMDNTKKTAQEKSQVIYAVSQDNK